jgi:hypothetical protein
MPTPTTTYTIRFDSGMVVQTTNPDSAERDSRDGATVTASTVGSA